MINIEDQKSLFELIANYIKKEISCYAIGGTAMMLLGYKNATKDIDLVFHSEEDMDIFIGAIKELGYKERALFGIYSDERSQDKNKPRMFTRGDERFDLFLKNVFSLELPKEYAGRFDFIGKKNLILFTPDPEWIITLKIITNRDRDIDDILSIAKIEKNIDWKRISENIIKQAKDRWLLLDLEKSLQIIKKEHLIKKEVFDMIYSAYDKI